VTCTAYSCQVMVRKTAETQPERERLSKEAVVDRGLELADGGGLESLTIRKLAQSLGVTPMALYWHFRSKDELLSALAERVWGELDLARDADEPWIAQFRRIFGSLIRVLRSHPAAPDLLMHDTKRSEAALRATEVALEVLRDAGFGPVHASAIARQALWTGIILARSDPAVHYDVPREELDEHLRKDRLTLSLLPEARFPRLVECAVEMTDPGDPEFHYQLGIDMFTAGVEAASHRQDAAL
jgi:TetR/AcrR family transcriptional regulator, tetracycline repressor protein